MSRCLIKFFKCHESYNIIQKKDYRSDLIPNQFIPVYKKQIEREKQYLKELSERLK